MVWETNWERDANTPLRSGNQGIVQRVIHRSTGVSGALKVLKQNDLKNSERVTRFKDEIAALKHITCLGVPKILEDGEEIGKIPYFICEWVAGKTLQDFVSGQAKTLETALHITMQLVEILIQIHVQNVVHRDIKPDNILLSKDEKLTLVDFGIAWFDSQDRDSDLTHEQGTRMGNYFLTLPEYYGKEDKRDKRSDITLVVGILFFLLTGNKPIQLRDSGLKAPHRGVLSSKFQAQAINDPRWPLIVSIFDIGFSPRQSGRFQTAIELKSHIEKAINFSLTQNQQESDYLAIALSNHQTARLAHDEQIDDVEGELLLAAKTLAKEVSLLTRKNGFNSPSTECAVESPGREVSVLWQMKRDNHNNPAIFYKLIINLGGNNKETVNIVLNAQHVSTSTLNNVYYSGRASDLSSLNEACKFYSTKIFVDALSDLTGRFK